MMDNAYDLSNTNILKFKEGNPEITLKELIGILFNQKCETQKETYEFYKSFMNIKDSGIVSYRIQDKDHYLRLDISENSFEIHNLDIDFFGKVSLNVKANYESLAAFEIVVEKITKEKVEEIKEIP